MYKLIVGLILSLSINSYGATSSQLRRINYCKNDSSKIYYVDLVKYNNALKPHEVKKGDLLAELSNGTAVVVPCNNDYYPSIERGFIQAIVVSQNNIFKPIANPKEGNLKAVGINYRNSTVLIEKKTLLILKDYLIVKSAASKKMKSNRFSE